jgi:hypothetical protein
MADIGKIWGADLADIGKLFGKDAAEVGKMWGVDAPSGPAPGLYLSNFYWSTSPYYVARCDYFDPTGNTWTSLTDKASLYGTGSNTGKSSRPEEGQKYDFDYYDSSYTNNVNQWDMGADSWTAKTAGGDYSYGLLASWDNGDTFWKCLALTNAGGFKDDCDSYSAVGDSWTDKTNRGGTLGYCGTGMNTQGDRMLGMGGNGGGFDTASNVYYDSGSNSWGSYTSHPQVHSGATGGNNQADDKVYSLGGRTYAGGGASQSWCYQFDFSANGWTTKTSANIADSDAGGGDPVLDDEVWMSCGYNKAGSPENGGRCQMYDISGNSWTTKAAFGTSGYRARSGWSST